MNKQANRKHYAAWAAVVTTATLCLALAPAVAAQDVAHVRAGSSSLDFQPVVEHGGLVLTVSGPGGFHHRAEFGAGESPTFSIFDEAGAVLPDGSYQYELTVVPTAVQRREALEANRLETRAGRQGIVPLIQSGSFAVSAGSIVAGGETENGTGSAATPGGNRLATKTQVIDMDLIVQGSECVGLDCTASESFGFDTLRLKENNTRIKFQDTSSASGFPTTDWQLTANDSASGGLNKFSIEDITGGKVPFTIEGDSTTNSIYVDSTGRVGFRTSTPVLDIHVATSNTPGLRLEQTSAGGFTAQTWDLAGNEANFFVRDVTGGSRLPFRIRPGAPTSSLDIAASGNVGIGTASPSGNLHVKDGTTEVLFAAPGSVGINTSAPGADLDVVSDTEVTVRLTRSDLGRLWDIENDGPLQLNEATDPDAEFSLTQGGNLTIQGTITTSGSCSMGCDLVFSPEYELESIEEHAARMWADRYLPAVGPTSEDGPFNLTEKTGGMLNELEKAHIYIEQLNEQVKAKDEMIEQLSERLVRVEAALGDG